MAKVTREEIIARTRRVESLDEPPLTVISNPSRAGAPSPVAQLVAEVESRPQLPEPVCMAPRSGLHALLARAAAAAEVPGPTYGSGLRLHAADSRMVELMGVLLDAIEASSGELKAGLKALRDLLF